MSNTIKEIITIDLANSSNAKSFEQGNIIHIEALKKVKKFIYDFQDEYENSFIDGQNDENEVKLSYKHNTITILGTRGSGKTSFLLSIKKAIKSDQNKRYNDLLFLDIIDPTLVEEKGHVFLNIISSICDEVKTVLEKKNPIHLKM
ncbi:hypothetical protein ACKUSY_09425 [Myroides odoratus]